MGLRDELEVKSLGGKCAVGLLLSELDKTVAGELQELMNDHTIHSSSLSRLCKTKGWRRVSSQSFQRHRRMDCKCH